MSADPAGPTLAKGPGAVAGISETMIRDLVHAFYAKVQHDAVLGPVFAARIADWPSHLDKMCAFWSSVVLSSGRYKGQPLAAHVRIADIERAHFARWLALFRQTADETCTPAAAELFADRASRFAQSFQVGIALHRAAAPPPASSSSPQEVNRHTGRV